MDAQGNIQFGVEESATTAGDGSVQTNLRVGFVAPAVAAAAGPGIPLLSLAATLGTGGTLTGGQTLYYAVAGVDASGNESVLSFIVRAITLSDGSSVSISGLSFSPDTVSFNVYRGSVPAQLFRIASKQAIAAQFTDTGIQQAVDRATGPQLRPCEFLLADGTAIGKRGDDSQRDHSGKRGCI